VLLSALLWLFLPAVRAMPALPPRPTGAPTFPASWPGTEVHWQTPWATVEWQDAQGDWHLVEGWQGQFDTVEVTEAVVGVKSWWLAPELYGAGPFRWVVYAERGGDVLARSVPFTLPGAGGQTTSVAVRLP